MNEKLTLQDAYRAMYIFVAELYARAELDQLGGILGGMSLLEDGKPADPAMWNDWLRAVAKARTGEVDIQLRLRETTKTADRPALGAIVRRRIGLALVLLSTIGGAFLFCNGYLGTVIVQEASITPEKGPRFSMGYAPTWLLAVPVIMFIVGLYC